MLNKSFSFSNIQKTIVTKTYLLIMNHNTKTKISNAKQAKEKYINYREKGAESKAMIGSTKCVRH